MRTKIVLLFASTLALFAAMSLSTGAAHAGGLQPTLTLVSSSNPSPGDDVTLEGTGCNGADAASVSEYFDFGGPNENFIGADFPISVTQAGTFTSNSLQIPSNANAGDEFTFIAKCGSPADQVPESNHVTVTVAGSSTTGSTAPSSSSTATTSAGSGSTTSTTTSEATAARATTATPTFTG